MAIRFQCASCNQPIEIDDEWASKLVSCPYCRKTVTAPAQSALMDSDRIPSAAPLPGEAFPATTPWPTPIAHEASTRPNRWAVVSLVLIGIALFILVLYLQVLTAHREEMTALFESGNSFAERIKVFNDYLDDRGGAVPGWLIAAGVYPLVGGLAWIGSIVSGIVALRHPRRRGMAVTALILAGFFPIVFCCGGALFGAAS